MNSERLLTLFIQELDRAIPTLTNHLLKIEQNDSSPVDLETLMRTAHSIKGGAKILSLESIINLAHSMEECFEKGQSGPITPIMNTLLKAIDSLEALAKTPIDEVPLWLQRQDKTLNEIAQEIKTGLNGQKHSSTSLAPKIGEASPLALRITPHQLNQLMGLAAEALVGSNSLEPLTRSLVRLKEGHYKLTRLLENIQGDGEGLQNAIQSANNYQRDLSSKINELELFWRRNAALSEKFYQEMVDIRMRPFRDLSEGLPRMVRDISQSLNKKVKLIIEGENTLVDREIVDTFEGPITHLLRNAIDHGIDSVGQIVLAAHHKRGFLEISVADDGRGIDLNKLSSTLLKKGLITSNSLTDDELLSHLFLPGMTTKDEVTTLSGRGYGLNLVKTAAEQMGGKVSIATTKGRGTTVTLTLPITRSLLSGLIVEIENELYAFPLLKIDKAFVIEGGKNLHYASEILGFETTKRESYHHVVEIGGKMIAVDRFIDERELVVQEIDKRLGKIPFVSGGATLENGAILLILDVDEITEAINKGKV